MNSVNLNLILHFSWDFIMQQWETGKASVTFRQDLHDNGIRNTLKATRRHHGHIFCSSLYHSSVRGKWGHSGQHDLQYAWQEKV